MRSALLIFALSVPAMASPVHKDYSIPSATAALHKAEKPTYVKLTFTSATGEHRQVRIGNTVLSLQEGRTTSVSARVGALVSVSSDQNSKVGGVLLTVTPQAADSVIVVR